MLPFVKRIFGRLRPTGEGRWTPDFALQNGLVPCRVEHISRVSPNNVKIARNTRPKTGPRPNRNCSNLKTCCFPFGAPFRQGEVTRAQRAQSGPPWPQPVAPRGVAPRQKMPSREPAPSSRLPQTRNMEDRLSLSPYPPLSQPFYLLPWKLCFPTLQLCCRTKEYFFLTLEP